MHRAFVINTGILEFKSPDAMGHKLTLEHLKSARSIHILNSFLEKKYMSSAARILSKLFHCSVHEEKKITVRQIYEPKSVCLHVKRCKE